MAVKFKRVIGMLGGDTGSLSVTIPQELASSLGIERGSEVELWYDEKNNLICIGVKK